MSTEYFERIVADLGLVDYIGSYARLVEKGTKGRVSLEDAKQEIFLGVFERVQRYYLEDKNLESFVRSAATHVASNLRNPYRNRLLQQVLLTEEGWTAYESNHPQDDWGKIDVRLSLDVFERSLSIEDKQVFRLLRNGATYVECHEQVGVSIRQVRKVVNEARRKL